MSCVPYMWQYCWKEISAVAYIFYLVHCLLRHEITLHVLCRDKYSTSMQQYCHPGNDSYKQEPYSLGLYAHHKRHRPNQMLHNVLLLLRTNLTLFLLLMCGQLYFSNLESHHLKLTPQRALKCSNNYKNLSHKMLKVTGAAKSTVYKL